MTKKEKAALKRKILSIVSVKQKTYFSDVSDKLELDLELVVGLCQELINEGRISLGD